VKIRFVYPRFNRHAEDHPELREHVPCNEYFGPPSLGIASVAAVTPTEHTIDFRDDRVDDPGFDDEVDLVAISCFTPSARRAMEIAGAFRERGRKVVMGGIFPTMMPDEAAAHADAIVVGEGDSVWPQILRDAAAGTLRPRYEGVPADVGGLPLPRVSTRARTRVAERPLRVTLCPVNTAGVPWTNTQALRRRGVDARLVVFERYRLHPEADWSLDLSGSLLRRQPAQWAAFARLLPRTDVFHFHFGLTLVPKRLQFPLLRAARKKSVMHYLGSDIRGKTPEELAYGKHADAQVVGSYDAIRWVPEAEVIPPGVDLERIRPEPQSDRSRPLIVHAPSSRRRKGTEHVL
jgi:glycosyltransferase involved in cell wall biosynthesis